MMRATRYFVLFICGLCAATTVTAQTVNFRASLDKNNPIATTSTLSLAQRVAIHQVFLEKATQKKDTLAQLYGNLYLLL